jgi:hypothetical protein
MGRNEDSLLRAAGENALASATRGGSCTHPDQSRGLAHRHNVRAISGAGASSPILLFFIGGGVALHERLVGTSYAGWQRWYPLSEDAHRNEQSSTGTLHALARWR